MSKDVFQVRSHGFPGIIGVMDSTHIKIKQPVDNAHDYYNRNKYHSVNLLAVCDENCKFINVATGFPGRLHDARVFRVSDLGQALANDHYQLVFLDERHLLADCAYPLLPYIMTLIL
ncbi:putative nuclease HARBI1 [Nilaparvata lugens]|uniref:putative nuclease HARBI1 n=1 Tax=Nilaparvata lugens TaxID=108931 RepID=UPI00193CB1A0|nr:putative nuclease HARBI1 [Nilaparvata lugens]